MPRIMTDPTDDLSTELLNSPHLFRHHYDIDTLLVALCAHENSTFFTGQITLPVAPLPASFLSECLHHPSFQHLPTSTQTAVHAFVASHALTDLPQAFYSPHGDWLRARVKDAALEWLDSHNLIPPSMRHVPRQTRQLNNTPKKVTIA